MRRLSIRVLSASILSVSVCAVSAQAAPLDFTPAASRIITDPAYLPTKGKVYGATGYNYGFTRLKSFNTSTGLQTNSSKITSQAYKQELAYGLTDMVTLRADVSYMPQNKVSTHTVTGITSIRNSDGFTNPNFGVTWRVLEQQKSAPVSVDLLADYAPDLIDSERANSNFNAGTVARGGDLANLGTQVSYQMRSLTLAGLGGVNYSGEREFSVRNSANTYDADSYWIFYVGADTQTRFNDRLSLDLGARYNLPTESDTVNNVSGQVAHRNPGDYATFNVGMNYHLIPNRLAASLTYEYTVVGDNKNTYVNPALNSRVETTNSSVFGAKLQYTFN